MRQKSWTVDSGFYSTMSLSLDRSPSQSLAQVQYDDNDSGHYEAVVPYEPGTTADPEGHYENPLFVSPHGKTQRSNSETMTPRVHGVHFAKRSISYNESERLDKNNITVQHLRRVGFHDPRGVGKGLDFSTDLSAQIAANAAEVAAHFQRKEDSDDTPASPEKWRPPVAKKNYFSPPTSPTRSPNCASPTRSPNCASPTRSRNFDKFWREMENPRRGVDNEFLDDSYKVCNTSSSESPNSFLSQIQQRRSSMKYVGKRS